MSDRKLTKGKYYSCQHQELGKSSCETCNKGGHGSIEVNFLKCLKCKKSLGNSCKKKFSGTETSYEVLDCYQNDEKLHTCIGCHEKNDNPERERERERAKLRN